MESRTYVIDDPLKASLIERFHHQTISVIDVDVQTSKTTLLSEIQNLYSAINLLLATKHFYLGNKIFQKRRDYGEQKLFWKLGNSVKLVSGSSWALTRKK